MSEMCNAVSLALLSGEYKISSTTAVGIFQIERQLRFHVACHLAGRGTAAKVLAKTGKTAAA